MSETRKTHTETTWGGRGVPPPPPPQRRHPILVVPPVGELLVVALAQGTTGHYTHWLHGERAMRICTSYLSEGCPLCLLHQAARPLWTAYLPVVWSSQARLSTLAIPRSAYSCNRQLMEADGDLLGRQLVLFRPRKSAKAPVFVRLLPERIDPRRLPPGWDCESDLRREGME